jgi:hypothetical protein
MESEMIGYFFTGALVTLALGFVFVPIGVGIHLECAVKRAKALHPSAAQRTVDSVRGAASLDAERNEEDTSLSNSGGSTADLRR